MVQINTIPTDTLRGSNPKAVLLQRQGPMRLTDVIEKTHLDQLQARKKLETLEVTGEIDRFVVGDHVFVELSD